MKYFKLFEEFNSNNYHLEEAIPGKKLALGSIGEPIKDINELVEDEMYWFPVPSGAGYDIPTLGCLGLTGDSEEYSDDTEFTSWADPEYYDEIVHRLARNSSNRGEYEGLNGLGGGEDSWITYDEMKSLIATGKVLKFKDDLKFRGVKSGSQYGLT